MLTTTSKKELLGGVHYTTQHQGKMTGMQSLSTSPLVNEHCIKRHAEGCSVCSHCFSFRMHKIYSKDFPETFKENTRILTTKILDKKVLPVICTFFFRFESFGDLNNWIQVANYFNLCKVNRDVKFALWTKNPWYIQEAIENGYKKPHNLQIILSSTLLNKPVSPKYDFIDKVFTVYDKEYIKEHNVTINCGAKSCVKCGLCYRKSKGGILFVNEVLK